MPLKGKQKRQEKRKARKEKRASRRDKLKWKLLLPFKLPMILALKAKRIKCSPKDSIQTIGTAFYHVIAAPAVKKGGHYEENHVESSPQEQQITKLIASGASAGAMAGGVPIPPDAINSVIQVIVDVIKNAKKKKANGEPLTSEEKTLLGALDASEDAETKNEFDKGDSDKADKGKTTAQIKNEIDKASDSEAGVSGKALIGVAAVAIVAYLAFK